MKLKNSVLIRFLCLILISVFSLVIFIQGICFAEPGMKITSPLDGTTVNPGQEITVTIESVEGFVIEGGVANIARSPHNENVTSLPYSFTDKIPMESIGEVSVSVIGRDASGNVAVDDITLKVEQIAELISFDFGDYTHFYFVTDWDGNPKADDKDYIRVKGVYSDDVTRKISREDLNFLSSDPTIVSVDSQGNIEPHKLGKAIITVSKGNVSGTVKVDVEKPTGLRPSETIPPTTSIDIQPPANEAGWHNQDITITITAQDNEGGSGVEEIDYQWYNMSGQLEYVEGDRAVLYLFKEGVNHLRYYAVDKERNEERESHDIEFKLDKTPPAITANVSPQPNSSGWNNTDVTVTFTASDSLSGVASVTPPIAITTEGANKQINGEAVDFAGNKGTTYATVNLDRTPPLLFFDLEPYKIELPFRLENFHFFMPFFYKLVYSSSDNLSGLKDLKAGLVVPNIDGFKTQLIKGKHTQIILDETKKHLSIIAPGPQSILNQLKTNMFLIENNQLMHLNQRPKLRIWTITKLDKFLTIKAPSVTFKAEAGDYADNSSTKQIQYLKKRIPLPKHIKPLINRRELSSEEIEELMEDAAIDRDTLKIIRKNYNIKY